MSILVDLLFTKMHEIKIQFLHFDFIKDFYTSTGFNSELFFVADENLVGSIN